MGGRAEEFGTMAGVFNAAKRQPDSSKRPERRKGRARRRFTCRPGQKRINRALHPAPRLWQTAVERARATLLSASIGEGQGEVSIPSDRFSQSAANAARLQKRAQTTNNRVFMVRGSDDLPLNNQLSTLNQLSPFQPLLNLLRFRPAKAPTRFLLLPRPVTNERRNAIG